MGTNRVGQFRSGRLLRHRRVRFGDPQPEGRPYRRLDTYRHPLRRRAGACLATTTLRLRDDYFALVTLGAGEVVRLIAVNEMWLTGGGGGLPGISADLSFLGQPVRDLPYLVLGLVAVAIVYFWLRSCDASPFGRILKAIREDEDVPRSLGRDIFAFKVQAFAAGAMIAGFSGALFAHYISVASPDQFLPVVTIYAWIAVMFGGAGNHLGAFVGALCLMTILELTRFAKDYLPFLEGDQLASARIILVGLLLIVLVKYCPNGVMPRIRKGLTC